MQLSTKSPCAHLIPDALLRRGRVNSVGNVPDGQKMPWYDGHHDPRSSNGPFRSFSAPQIVARRPRQEFLNVHWIHPVKFCIRPH